MSVCRCTIQTIVSDNYETFSKGFTLAIELQFTLHLKSLFCPFDPVFYSTPFLLYDILLILCCLGGVSGMFWAGRDVVLFETKRWEDKLTYFFIWTTLNRKEGWQMRREGKGNLFLICITSLLFIHFYLLYFNAPCTCQTLLVCFPQPVIHVT